MVKYLDVNVGDREVWYFTCDYNKNVSRINSPLINIEDEESIIYFAKHVKYTLLRHSLASVMLTEKQYGIVCKMMVLNKGVEAYEYVNNCSRIILEDVEDYV